MAFGQVGDPRPRFGAEFQGLLAEHFRPAVIGVDHSQEHLDQGRFARAVASQEAVDQPLGDAQIERIDRAAVPIIFRQAVGNDHVGHGGHVSFVNSPLPDRCAVPGEGQGVRAKSPLSLRERGRG